MGQADVAAGEAEAVPVQVVLLEADLEADLVADLAAGEALAEAEVVAAAADEAVRAGGEGDAAARMPRLSAIAPGAPRIPSEPSCSLRRKTPR